MEGIFALIVLWFVFSFVRKAATMTGKQENKKQAESAPHKQEHKQKKPHHKAEQATMDAMLRSAPAPARPVAYQPIQPRVGTGMAYVGSLGGSSTEGMRVEGDTEGEDTCDQSLGHGGRIALEHVPTMAESAPLEALPEQWNAQALVQAVVMNEVLNRPQRRWGKS